MELCEFVTEVKQQLASVDQRKSDWDESFAHCVYHTVASLSTGEEAAVVANAVLRATTNDDSDDNNKRELSALFSVASQREHCDVLELDSVAEDFTKLLSRADTINDDECDNIEAFSSMYWAIERFLSSLGVCVDRGKSLQVMCQMLGSRWHCKKVRGNSAWGYVREQFVVEYIAAVCLAGLYDLADDEFAKLLDNYQAAYLGRRQIGREHITGHVRWARSRCKIPWLTVKSSKWSYADPMGDDDDTKKNLGRIIYGINSLVLDASFSMQYDSTQARGNWHFKLPQKVRLAEVLEDDLRMLVVPTKATLRDA